MAQDCRVGGGRKNRLHGAVGGALRFLIHLLLQAVDALCVQNAFAQQPHLHLGERVAGGFRLDLFLAAVLALVVGESASRGGQRAHGPAQGRGQERA